MLCANVRFACVRACAFELVRLSAWNRAFVRVCVCALELVRLWVCVYESEFVVYVCVYACAVLGAPPLSPLLLPCIPSSYHYASSYFLLLSLCSLIFLSLCSLIFSYHYVPSYSLLLSLRFIASVLS
jgi:hypothetical protein